MNRAQSYQSIVYAQEQKAYHFDPRVGQPNNVNHYGLISPRSKEKKNLIDQIIHKCEKTESKISLNRCSQAKGISSPSNRSRATQDKENSFGYKYENMAKNPLDRLGQRKKSLEKKSCNMSSRSSAESCGKPNLSGSSAHQISLTTPEAQEYFRKNSPGHPHILSVNKPPVCRPSSNAMQGTVSPRKNISIRHNTPGFYSSSVSDNMGKSGFYVSNGPSNLTKKAGQLKKQIERQKQQHIQHCKNEQRKLRLFYVQLENKLCEVRNRDLQTLARYQASKLQQFDSCLRKIEKQSTNGLEDCQRDLERLSKQFIVRVNEVAKPEMQGCLATGVSGVLFSFDQTSSGEPC